MCKLTPDPVSEILNELRRLIKGMDDETLQPSEYITVGEVSEFINQIKEKRSFPQFQKEVGNWGNETFTEAHPDSIIAHLRREVVELQKSHEPEESADCLLLLLHHAHQVGYDLLEETKKKFEIIKKRKWGSPDEEGVVEHIKEEDASV